MKSLPSLIPPTWFVYSIVITPSIWCPIDKKKICWEKVSITSEGFLKATNYFAVQNSRSGQEFNERKLHVQCGWANVSSAKKILIHSPDMPLYRNAEWLIRASLVHVNRGWHFLKIKVIPSKVELVRPKRNLPIDETSVELQIHRETRLPLSCPWCCIRSSFHAAEYLIFEKFLGPGLQLCCMVDLSTLLWLLHVII